MRKVLIAGSSGYIGVKLSSELNGDIYGTSNKEGIDGLKNPFLLELTSPDDFRYDLLNEDWTIIYLAAISSPDLCEKEYDVAYKVNVLGTEYFIERCLKKGARVLFFSSDAVYGKGHGAFDENSKCSPFGKYAEMKYEVEQKFQHDNNFKVFRLSYVFSKDDKFMNYLGQCAGNKEIAKVFDAFSRNIVYISDLICAVGNLVEAFDNFKPKVVNICGDKLLSRRDLAELFRKYVDESFEYELSDPGAEFFKYRSKIIETKSLYLKNLLERVFTPIEKAMQIEFNKQVK